MKNLLTHKNQKGAALIVSMIFLVILTILVLGSLRGAAMNSKMALNTQLINSFNTPVDGEVYAQMDYFSRGGNDIDKTISDAIEKKGGVYNVKPKMNEQLYKNQIVATPTSSTDKNCVNIAKIGTKNTSGRPEANGQTGTANIYDCLAVGLYDLTNAAKDDAVIPYFPTARSNFIHGRLCHGFGQTVGCKNMVLNVLAERNRLGKSNQSIGFGVVAPASKGIQGIKN